MVRKEVKQKKVVTVEEFAKQNGKQHTQASGTFSGKSLKKSYNETNRDLTAPQPANGGVRKKTLKAEKRKALVSQKMTNARPIGERPSLSIAGYDLKALYRQLKMMADPFNCEPGKSVVNFNPVPSLITSIARTNGRVSVSITGNAACFVYLFPGHGPIDPTATMDGVSYHGGYLTLAGGAVRVVGPMTTSSTLGINACYQTGIPINQMPAISAMAPIDNLVALPYTAVTDNGGHTRWKLLSAGVKVVPSSANLDRGGTVTTVQPSSKVSFAAATNMDTMSIFPTFRIHEQGTLDQEFKISWLPRIDDMSFWHSKLEAATDLEASAGIGLIVQIANPTAQALTYTIETVNHWEVSGSNLTQLGSPNLELPGVKEPITAGVGKIANGSGFDASSIVSHVKSAVGVAASLYKAFQ